MAASGYQRIINVDYSTEVIERQKKRQQPFGLEWITADCVEDLQRPLAHQSYGVVIEKTLTDCIACGDDALLTRQHQMARQIAAVQPTGGMWLCISFSADRKPWPPYTLKHKIPLLVPQPNDTKAHAPDIYYYLYVLQKE
ncbi:hypothetical protein [Absidia glauca]|uniref:Methyltransferase type 11 domain-containing protein n=1 Tax=Absidia glauca TaxID=4829 RepID=A0A168MH94_ABSGL|nr:hypothetical protein [Absidia glauca]